MSALFGVFVCVGWPAEDEPSRSVEVVREEDDESVCGGVENECDGASATPAMPDVVTFGTCSGGASMMAADYGSWIMNREMGAIDVYVSDSFLLKTS